MYLELHIENLSSVIYQWCSVSYCGSGGEVNKTRKLRGEYNVYLINVMKTSLWKREFWGIAVIAEVATQKFVILTVTIKI
jgi:hypothetical protein